MPDSLGTNPLRIVVSACLLGQSVRYNGGHKLAPALAHALTSPPLLSESLEFSAKFSCLHINPELLIVCPEMECGLGVPREPMRLEGDPLCPTVMTVNSRRDLTALLGNFIRMRIRGFGMVPPDAAVLKKGSPSCGVRGAPVFGGPGDKEILPGSGVFALAFCRAFPFVPVVQEDELELPGALNVFWLRVVLARMWRLAVHSGEQNPVLFFNSTYYARAFFVAFGVAGYNFICDFPCMHAEARSAVFSRLLKLPLVK